MRVRKVDANGDHIWGQGAGSFWIDQPEGVAQVVRQRLLLYRGEWFLDVTDGTPWYQSVLGVRTKATRDTVIRARILQTQGVTGITAYTSVVDGTARSFSVQASISTLYGPATISVTV